MHVFTNSGAVLLGVLLFFLLIFIAELSYIFCRRTGAFPDDPPSPASKKMEDVVVATSTEVVEDDDVAAAEKRRVSRLLFTIEEDDLEMEEDDVISAEEEEEVNNDCRVEIPVEFSGEPTPFLTPCDSPPYFTPSPSPGRDIDDVINVYDVSSRDCCFNFQGSHMC